MDDATLLEPPADDAVRAEPLPATGIAAATEWWRDAVIYQVYPRSFADADGDGVGDLAGIAARLPAIADLGVDAVWLSPFYTSPQKDAGYDVADYVDVDPIFGTLADADALIEEAHRLGLRIIVDLVPNHSSSAHPWFQAALASAPGSPERARYWFVDGKGEGGDTPPNNWESIFGGPAWTRVVEPDGTPGQWYLHLFDSSQPDLNWENPWVAEQFRGILRFWLDKGVDGFRIDVAHGMAKAPGLPDYTPPAEADSMGGDDRPYFGQEAVHPIYRDWRRIVDEYPGERILTVEAWVEPLAKLAHWVRPDEAHQAFNFAYAMADWDAAQLRAVIDESLAAFASVGAPSTWVLSNHDVIRHPTRLSLTEPVPQGDGIGATSPGLPTDPAQRQARGRAATALMLALPGSSYLYQGEELGLPEVVDLPDDARQDPTWFRTNHERWGRDGCRVPIPWEADAPGAGFSPTGASWLPQPNGWGEYARDRQLDDPTSTLAFYRAALATRREFALGTAGLEWLDGYPPAVVAFRVGGLTVIANTGDIAVELPASAGLVLASTPLEEPGIVGPDTTVWLIAD